MWASHRQLLPCNKTPLQSLQLCLSGGRSVIPAAWPRRTLRTAPLKEHPEVTCWGMAVQGRRSAAPRVCGYGCSSPDMERDSAPPDSVWGVGRCDRWAPLQSHRVTTPHHVGPCMTRHGPIHCIAQRRIQMQREGVRVCGPSRGVQMGGGCRA